MQMVFVLILFLFGSGLADLVVQIQNGKVQGTALNTSSGQTYYTWRGIPYGKPPVGKLRYLPPVKAESWDGILDASKDSPACVFFGTYAEDPVPTNGESEDCLYVNVYSPIPVGSNSSVNATLPVLFWIYGGGFFAGTGDFAFYDPTPFLEEDVIVVTFNYRLGYFGFLSTGDDVVLGNAGLKDQLLALKWTRENIAFFGGNPLDITMFGESAGAISVGYHIVSPMSRNLFQRAILQSGCSIFNIIQKDGRDYAFTLASRINSSITNASTSEEVRYVLQAAPVDLILNLTDISIRVTPVLEVKSDLSFLTSPLYETVESGDIARVPIIIGHTSEEWISFANDMVILLQQAIQYDASPELLVPNMPLKENISAVAVGKEIHQKYVGEEPFSGNLAAYLNWASDNRYVRGAYKQATLQSKYSPVYMYQFSFDGTLSKNNIRIPGAGRVGHAQELGYMFNISTKHIETEKDYLTRRRLVKLWSNFAKTSNPTPDDDSADLLQNVKWEPITQNDIHYLDIDENLQIRPSRKVNESIFWDYIWESYSYRPYNTY